jgi:transposase
VSGNFDGTGASNIWEYAIVKDIKRATRKRYSSEEKIRIVLDGLRGEGSIAELCRREGISQGIY